MAGFKIVPVNTDKVGGIDMSDLSAKVKRKMCSFSANYQFNETIKVFDAKKQSLYIL